MQTITDRDIECFRTYLTLGERAPTTIQKYVHDLRRFRDWLEGAPCDREMILRYKAFLTDHLAPASVNSALAALNAFWGFRGEQELRVRSLRIQRQLFLPSERELSREEYERLLQAALAHDKRLYLLLQTVCSTGIRISELRCITVEAVEAGEAEIDGKGKRRRVLLPMQLCQILRSYIRERELSCGPVFVTANGHPMDRSNIWVSTKKMARIARVPEKKVFPHNLRHLFARTYYSSQKDVLRLADILGHTNVNTTRIYTMESGETHREQIQDLGLLHNGFTT